MKQFALTLSILCVCAAIAWAGPEALSGTDMKETVAPIESVEWYSAHEWNVSIWGTYVFAANEVEHEVTPTMNCWEPDRYLGADDAWGGGIDLKYFFHQNIGVGVEAFGLAVHRDAPNLGTVVFGETGQIVIPH